MLTDVLRRVVLKKNDKFLFRNMDIELPKDLKSVGLYVHIPFCRSICSFCPYNKDSYDKNKARLYIEALKGEILTYSYILKDISVESLYFGGGTPTLVSDELYEVIGLIKQRFNINGDVGIEVHPNEASVNKLKVLKEAGVNMISLGVQSFNDCTLKKIGRPYNGDKAMEAFENVKSLKFDSVDVDILFAIPGQTMEEVLDDVRTVFIGGADQISSYPLIMFPFTGIKNSYIKSGDKLISEAVERKMLNTVFDTARSYGYKRTSIWTFSKENSKRYTSITRRQFIGMGAGASSLVGNNFYVNTFHVDEYIKTAPVKLPIALVNRMSHREKELFWLFWRCYDTEVNMEEYKHLFGKDFKKEYPFIYKVLKIFGREEGDIIRLTRTGAYIYHRIEKAYSLTYLNDMWSRCMETPWPEEIKL